MTILNRSFVVVGMELKWSRERETANAAADPDGSGVGAEAPKTARQFPSAARCELLAWPVMTLSYSVSPRLLWRHLRSGNVAVCVAVAVCTVSTGTVVVVVGTVVVVVVVVVVGTVVVVFMTLGMEVGGVVDAEGVDDESENDRVDDTLL
jgi:hypothetical protein